MESSIFVGELLREISRRHNIVTSTYASRLTSSVKTLNYKAIWTRINLKYIFLNDKIIKSSKYKELFLNSYTEPKTLYQWLRKSASSRGETRRQQWIRTANEKNQKLSVSGRTRKRNTGQLVKEKLFPPLDKVKWRATEKGRMLAWFNFRIYDWKISWILPFLYCRPRVWWGEV